MPAVPRMPDALEDQIYNLHEESHRLLNEGDVPGALAAAEKAHGLATAHSEQLSPAVLLDTLYLLADTLVEAEAADEALALYAEIARLAPNDPDLPLHRGIALLHLARFDEAEADLERAQPEGEDEATALWHRAVLAEFRGDEAAADRLFAEAHRRAPGPCPLPVRLTPDEVQGLLSAVIEDLPEQIRAAVANVVIQVEPLPSPDLLTETEPPLSPFLLGLHVGTPRDEQSVFDSPRDVDRILIFQRNIERIAADAEGLHEQLRITLLHEIGHQLGWDEDDLAERGLE